MLIGGAVALALLVGGGLWYESSGEVGKLEKISVDESDFGKLRARTLREVGSFEASLSGMTEDTAKLIRPHLKNARAEATAASNAEQLEKARAHLQTVRSLAGGK
jgi:hypothetical protein